jgi:hypothetical protein
MCTCAHKILSSTTQVYRTAYHTYFYMTCVYHFFLSVISIQGVSQLKIVLCFTYLYYRVPGIKKLNNTCYVLNMYTQVVRVVTVKLVLYVLHVCTRVYTCHVCSM